jgi:chromosomal replication initiation ATPase DnaA
MSVLLAGRTAPAHWNVGLPDLASRLRAMSVVTVRPPDDALLSALLSQFLADRQLRVSQRVQEYLLSHLPRTGGALREAAARLDRLALAQGGRTTCEMAAIAVDGCSMPNPELLVSDCGLVTG